MYLVRISEGRIFHGCSRSLKCESTTMLSIVKTPSGSAHYTTARRVRLILVPQSHRFEENSLRPLTIEFSVVHAFPRSEVQFAVRDRDEYLMSQQHAFEVRVGVIFTGCVVVIIRFVGCKTLEPRHNVAPQSGLMVVHENARGDVHSRDENRSIA